MQIQTTSLNFGLRKLKPTKNITKEYNIYKKSLKQKKKHSPRIMFSNEFLEKMELDKETRKKNAEILLNNIKSFIEKKRI